MASWGGGVEVFLSGPWVRVVFGGLVAGSSAGRRGLMVGRCVGRLVLGVVGARGCFPVVVLLLVRGWVCER